MRVEVVGGVYFVGDGLLPRWFRGARFRAEGECYSRVGRSALILGCRPTTTTAIVVAVPLPFLAVCHCAVVFTLPHFMALLLVAPCAFRPSLVGTPQVRAHSPGKQFSHLWEGMKGVERGDGE